MDFGYQFIEKIGPGFDLRKGQIKRGDCKKNQIAEVLHDGSKWYFLVDSENFSKFVLWVEDTFGEIEETLEAAKTVWVKG